MILMMGCLTSGQYIIQGSGLAGEATAAEYESRDNGPTKLWHQRQGHMSEVGLQVFGR